LDRPVFVRSPPRRGETQPGNDASVPPRPFTPTPVGNTSTGMPPITGRPVYPHARGEHVKIGRLPMGTVPFTPTPVGNTFASENGVCFAADHPHARGEHAIMPAAAQQRLRSPPRTRGTRFRKAGVLLAQPITPAHGEHESKEAKYLYCTRSPPPSQGTPRTTQPSPALGPITPTLTGNTAAPDSRQRASAEHPRVRGEHLLTG